MDDALEIPELLAARPMADSNGLIETAGISAFNLASQSVPECSDFQGVRVFRDFLSVSESDHLIQEFAQAEFKNAQSGKRKRHYGPKFNFNKKKINADGFRGLPRYATDIEDRVRAVAVLPTARSIRDDGLHAALSSFETTDLFILQYREKMASNLDFHIDDTFAYGELILDLSLESDCVLTFMRKHQNQSDGNATKCIRVPLPARSLVAIYGQARFDWEHAILAYDVEGRRTSITLRTLHEDLRSTKIGLRVLESARRSCPRDRGLLVRS
jgi:alkylated DNA repair protein alkB family protein 4